MVQSAESIAISKVISQDFTRPSLVSLHTKEQLGELFSYELTFSSDDENLDLESILGHTLAVHARFDDGLAERFYHGYVVEMSHEGWTAPGRTIYRALIKPWLWLLTQNQDSRVFQDLSVPDIISRVFSEFGFTEDYAFNLNASYPPRAYCLQYRESAFHFLSRLMQEEGMYFFFEHVEDSHKLIITDSNLGHLPLSQSLIPFYQPTENVVRDEMNFDQWVSINRVRAGVATLNSYDFIKPRASLLSSKEIHRNHDFSGFEQYDYPGNYFEYDEGERRSRLRVEGFHADAEVFKGRCNVLDSAPGYTFTLNKHPMPALNTEYVVLSNEQVFHSRDPDSRQTDLTAALFHSQLHCVNNDVTYRPPRTTRKPLISGPQHALVVGPSGEEIYVDEYGRIKVHFYWDRESAKDENSSCWIRVAQTWAGSGWGAQFIPRIGQEVMVEFFEGDPDRPIVTGRVYNNDNMPPYSLPENKTQSGIKTRSSPGGSPDNFNEIRFEDSKGNEELYIQAEKNEKILVKNCKTEDVRVNETIYIGNNRNETVGKNETLHVKNNRERTVDKNESISVYGLRNHFVRLNEMINVAGAQEINVGGFQALDVGLYQMINVGGYQDTNVVGYQHTTIGMGHKLTVKEGRETAVGEDDKLEAGKSLEVKAGKKVQVEAGDEISLETGLSKLVMKKDGTVEITGLDITVKNSAGGTININAAGIISINGNMVKINT